MSGRRGPCGLQAWDRSVPRICSGEGGRMGREPARRVPTPSLHHRFDPVFDASSGQACLPAVWRPSLPPRHCGSCKSYREQRPVLARAPARTSLESLSLRVLKHPGPRASAPQRPQATGASDFERTCPEPREAIEQKHTTLCRRRHRTSFDI